MAKCILIVDDEESIRHSLRGALRDEGFRVLLSKGGVEAIEILSKEAVDLILLDIWMPGYDGLDVLKKVKEGFPKIPIIMMSGHGTVETAVKATKLGAFDFIEKPLSLEKLLLVMMNAFNAHSLAEENRLLRQKMGLHEEMIGESEAIRKLKEQVEIVGPTNSWILISGENGVGKELVARMIHARSARRQQPFVEVNCAAIPEELIESELFGHEKGAFTGAVFTKRGKFDLADQGTLFLDEIGDMSLKTQAKILRILQEQKFERVGGNATLDIDVRVITATNKNLAVEIKEGRFREDLYYRLNVIPFFVSPLRERKGDIPLLVDHFLTWIAHENGKKEKKVTASAMEKLMRYNWPGNIRELKNIIERVFIMTPGELIAGKDIPLDPPHEGSDILEGDFRKAKTHFEKEYLLSKLEKNGWNVSKTAKDIGLERSHLHRKMRFYNLIS